MRVTKFVHSCLLVETGEKTVLIDPGKYSWDSHLLPLGKLERLDFVVITHEHEDHYHLPFVQALTQRFPHAAIVTNGDLAAKLQDDNVAAPITTGSEEGLTVFTAEHEPLPMNRPVPANIGVHIDDFLTHPGDALNIAHARQVLALPITAPWGSFKQSLEKVAEVKPRTVIPIHDWHWHKEARQEMYRMASQLLLPHGIKFIELENASPVEL